MLGMMQPDRHGWALDAEGNPELWCFVGNIMKDCCCSSSDCCYEYSTDHCNKLLLLGIDSNGRVFIKHDFGQLFPWPGVTNGRHKEAWGGLEWISRDVFVVYKGKEENDVPNGHIKAFKISENGSTNYANWSITGEQWSRQTLKPGYNGGQNINNSHMGLVAGFTSIPSFVNLSLNDQAVGASGERNANIVAMTGKIPYTQSSFNGHVAIYNLSSDANSLENSVTGSGYAKSTAWTAGEEQDGTNTLSAWKKIIGWGEPEQYQWALGNNGCSADAPANNKWDVDEGWTTIDSKGNLFYGTSQYLGGGKVDYGSWRTPIQRWDKDHDPWCQACGADVVVWCSTMKVVASGNGFSTTRKPMVFDRPSTMSNGTAWPAPHASSIGAGWHYGNSPYAVENGVDFNMGLHDGGIPYDVRGLEDGQSPGADVNYHCNFDQSHKLEADSGCCDIYGESQGLLAKAGDETGTVAITSDDAKDTIWLLVTPNASWRQPETSAMRAGIWAVKETVANVLEVKAFYPCKNSGDNGWNSLDLVWDEDHGPINCGQCSGDARPYCANRLSLNSGFSFRPNSYTHS
jgi:hypothetical protein